MEFDDQAKGLERLGLSTPLTIPVRLLTRSRYSGIEAGAFEVMVEGLERDWLRLLGPRCVKIPVAHSGHYIHRDQPAVFLAEVDALLGEQRASGR
ncbi:MAG: hypothetical protein IPL39_25190 [Opitutaceae bacterium]|nr:hypothetical protein [Opitutaceae bacterium]